MSGVAPNSYAEWRLRSCPGAYLHEGSRPRAPKEKFLQQIWHHQRLLRDQLKSLDGDSIRVLHPGFWNRESGPDFKDAIIQFGTDPPRRGDIEVDIESCGWRGHKHHENPAFTGVILHVVWDGKSRPVCTIPTLAMASFLDAPVKELEHWLAGEPMPGWALTGECSAPLRNLDAKLVEKLFHQAAEVRLQKKAEQFHARARHVGWEQALWEGLFGALGYKHNVWPMRRLAELIPALTRSESSQPLSVFALQVRLLGASALLPSDVAASDASAYVRRAWHRWWRERDTFEPVLLPRTAWRLHGLRPANHPQRRLALAAHWVARRDLMQTIGSWIEKPISDRLLRATLLEVLNADEDDFWSTHWTLRSKPLPKPQPLLGPQRLTDVAVNIVLPWLWTRAVAGANEAMMAEVEKRYFAWPAGEDNAVLRLARSRLFGDSSPRIRTASAQQALLQIVRDFCHHSNALCQDCRFPALVKALE